MTGKIRSYNPNPITILGILHILNDGFLASLPLLLPFIQKDMNIEFGKIGLLTGLLNSAGVIFALPAASIAMILGGYRVLIFSVFLYSSAFIITGLSSGFYMLILAFILASIGFGMFHPISFALIANKSDDKELGNKMGNFTAIGDIGRIGIAACVTILVSLVDWRNTAFIYGAFPIFLVLFSFIFCKNPDDNSSTSRKNAVKIHGLRSTTDYLIAIITSFIDSLASSSLFIFIPFLFVYRGASTALLGTLSGAFFIGNMLGKIVIGKLTDTIGSKKIFIISELLMSILLIVLSLLENIVLIAAVSILLGAVTKGTVPVINTLVAKAVPDRKLNEKAFGIVTFVNGVAAVIASILLGFIAQKFNITSVFTMCACFSFLAIFPLLLSKLITREV